MFILVSYVITIDQISSKFVEDLRYGFNILMYIGKKIKLDLKFVDISNFLEKIRFIL